MNDYWLLGFIEAKGNFNIYIHNEKDKKIPRARFTINTQEKYKNNMKQIVNFLLQKRLEPYPGVGYNKKNVRLEIKDTIKQRFRCLGLYNFLSKLQWQTKKYADLQIWGKVLNKIHGKKYLTKKELSKLSKKDEIYKLNYPIDENWLLGYIEAKGSFFISVQTGKKIVNKFRPGFNLNVKSRERQTLQKIKKFFEKKQINPYGLRELSNGSLKLEIKGLENCINLYNYLSKLSWQTIKKDSFVKWGQTLSRLQRNKHPDENERYFIYLQSQRIN